ncbi:MAG: RiPP maturation radical SAM protein 1 [Verrucomicrobia bacterium]|nr:RiPP maturation radical SAM protein 1 [Verrucomicrobiota bacterium]
MPSIALTQLAAVVKKRFGDRVVISNHYLNLDFATYVGDVSLYEHSQSATAFRTGIGEWFFRQSAFPNAEDNSEAYYAHYYHKLDEATQTTWKQLVEKRAGLNDALDEMIDQHQLLAFDLVGFTALFSQTVASLAMARRIKASKPDVMTVLGGPQCDAEMGMELATQTAQFDAIFSGPALESFPQFVGHLLGEDRTACDTINGVFTQTNRNHWPGSSQGSQIGILGDSSDINDCIPLDYDAFLTDLNTAFPDGSQKPALLFETSRGCWWAQREACTFCGLNGLHMRHQHMTPENAIAHLRSLYRYAPQCNILMGVDTALPQGYTEHVLPHAPTPEGMSLFYELRPGYTAEQIGVLVEAGVRAFQPGIESLATASLKLMHKGTTAFQNIQFLKSCSAHPLRLDWNLLVFSPGEVETTYDKMLHDIPLLTHLAPPSGAYPIGFVRFSRYFESPAAFELELTPEAFYTFTFPFSAESVRNLAYHFNNSKADNDHINGWLDRLNAAISSWTERWLGTDGKPQAQLCFASDDTSCAVYDSRSGAPLEIEISQTEKQMLDALSRPRTLDQLRDTFGPDGNKCVQAFKSRGWLFEEDDRLLSLIT